MLQSIQILIPEIFLSGAALALLAADAFSSSQRKGWVGAFTLLTLGITAYLVMARHLPGRAFGMIASDGVAAYFKLLALLSAALVYLISEKDRDLLGRHAGTYATLILLSTAGVMFLCGAEDLLILFIGLELTTIPLFILAGFARRDLRSSEAAIKFFLVGAFSTGIMLFGMSFLYGLTGSTHFGALRDWVARTPDPQTHAVLLIGALFVFAGLAFKMSLVPFHQWTPDTYEGAPTPVTAFFSVSRDAGVIVVMLRLFSEFLPQGSVGFTGLFAVLAAVTMTVGNLAAVRQDNLKRLLAYSSIAHAGTIFIGVVANNQLGREGAMIYSLAYFLMSLGAFAVVIAVSRVRNSDEISAVQGLAKENFPLAFLMLFFLLSLSGIPPFLGFWGKFYVFSAAIEAKMYLLVAIGLLNAIVSVYYYFRIAHRMFFQEAAPSWKAIPSPLGQRGVQVAAIFAAAVLIFFGIFPQQILAWVKDSAHFLP